PHPVGTEAHNTVADYIVDRLKFAGYSVEVQGVAAGKEYSKSFTQKVSVTNILARIRGTNSSQSVLLASHYDSVPLAPGAADDGYAVGSMLEVARLMALGPPLKNDVVFLFTDGEECGRDGAKAFTFHPWFRNIGTVFNFDARGM